MPLRHYLQLEATMATVDRIHRILSDYAHTHEHAAWWELIAYVLAAMLVGFAMASAFTFAFPRVMPSF
jgi:hypothetical protein